MAIAAGICDGIGYCDNSKAAILTRGMTEMTRLGVKMGANKPTFSGLSGIGDLLVTALSKHSRNRFVGEQLAKGHTWLDIQDSMDNVAEGVKATKAALVLAKDLGVEMPIAEMASRVLFEGLSPQKAMDELMARPARSEW